MHIRTTHLHTAGRRGLRAMQRKPSLTAFARRRSLSEKNLQVCSSVSLGIGRDVAPSLCIARDVPPSRAGRRVPGCAGGCTLAFVLNRRVCYLGAFILNDIRIASELVCPPE